MSFGRQRQNPSQFGFLFCLAIFSPNLFAVDDGCAGRIREVVELGGVARVAKVEFINDERSQELLSYSRGASVQAQLSRKDNFGFLAIRNEAVAGFVVYERRARYFNIVSIAVSKSNEGQGVGRDLIERVVKQAREKSGIDEVQVLVRSDDARSIEFFSRVGLTQTEVIPNKFDQQTRSGVLFKTVVRGADTTFTPKLQLAPRPVVRRPRLAVVTIPIAREVLLDMDPTLASLKEEN